MRREKNKHRYNKHLYDDRIMTFHHRMINNNKG